MRPTTTATFRPHRGQQTQRFQGEFRRILEIRRDVVDPRGIAAGAGRAEDDEQHHGAGRVLPAAGLKEQLEILKKSVDTNLNKLPSHQDFIQKYCPSSIAES